MLNLINVHPKSYCLKYPLSDCDGIGKGTCANHLARWFVLDPKDQVAAAFVGDGNAITEKFAAVVLILRFFEFKGLCFRRRGAHRDLESRKTTGKLLLLP